MKGNSMEESIFTLWYDDNPNDVVDTISKALKIFGLMIEEIPQEKDAGQGYVIKKIYN